jgi:hypothetical protein
MRATRVCRLWYSPMTITDCFLQILTQHRDQRDRAVLALAELCMEREDELARAPRSSSPAPRTWDPRHMTECRRAAA